MASACTDGVAGVAVEQLARQLGATKGSFYWHFADRAALIEAALALWEREHTADVIALMHAESEPSARLRALFTAIVTAAARDRVELPLLAHATDPVVRPVLERVAARRIAYVTDAFLELGSSPEDARQRGLLG